MTVGPPPQMFKYVPSINVVKWERVSGKAAICLSFEAPDIEFRSVVGCYIEAGNAKAAKQECLDAAVEAAFNHWWDTSGPRPIARRAKLVGRGISGDEPITAELLETRVYGETASHGRR